MVKIFSGTLLFVTVFSFLGASGYTIFETLKLQAIGKESFEFFLYLLITLTGCRGLLASRETSTLFRLAGGMTKLTEGAYISISGGILGWIAGISLFAIVRANANDVALGFFLFVLMLILSGAPLAWLKEIETDAREFIEFRLRKRRFKNVFRILCLLFIFIGIWGFTQFFS